MNVTALKYLKSTGGFEQHKKQYAKSMGDAVIMIKSVAEVKGLGGQYHSAAVLDTRGHDIIAFRYKTSVHFKVYFG